MAKTPWEQLWDIGARQAQAIAVRQAVDCGIPRRTFTRTVKRYRWPKLFRGVRALPGSKNTYERKLWAVRLALGPDTVFTGETALWLRRIVTATPKTVDVLVGPNTHHRDHGYVRFIRATLPPEARTVRVDGHRITPVPWAFTDAARLVPLETLIRWLVAADRLRLCRLEDIEAAMAARGRFAGKPVLQAAVAVLRRELSHSGKEKYARRLLRDADLKPHPRPYAVEVRGAKIAEIDLAYPAVRYGAEVDGPHHDLPEVAHADKVRDRRLHREGWIIDRFRDSDIERDPEGFVAEVRAGLRRAAERSAMSPDSAVR